MYRRDTRDISRGWGGESGSRREFFPWHEWVSRAETQDGRAVTHRHRRMTLTLASFCDVASFALHLDGAALLGRLDAMASLSRARQWPRALRNQLLFQLLFPPSTANRWMSRWLDRLYKHLQ